jgi:hypothetical protein
MSLNDITGTTGKSNKATILTEAKAINKNKNIID